MLCMAALHICVVIGAANSFLAVKSRSFGARDSAFLHFGTAKAPTDPQRAGSNAVKKIVHKQIFESFCYDEAFCYDALGEKKWD